MSFATVAKVNARGQVVIPSGLRKKLRMEANSNVSISATDDGAIQIRPVAIVEKSLFLENNPEIRKEVIESYNQIRKGETVDEEQTIKAFKSLGE